MKFVIKYLKYVVNSHLQILTYLVISIIRKSWVERAYYYNSEEACALSGSGNSGFTPLEVTQPESNAKGSTHAYTNNCR